MPIEISRVDEENEENKIRRDRLWHAMGFRFPPGKPAQCRCGQTNCSCRGAGVQRSGWSPRYPRYAGWKTVIARCRKKSCSSKAKTVAKTVNYFTSESSILSSVAQERGQLPDEKYDALPLRAEKLSLPQSGDSDTELAQPATGVIRLATLCAQSQKRILELERDLASQSEELADLQAHPFSDMLEKIDNQSWFWVGVLSFSGLYLLDVGA
ncbi:hypothetical protein [Klebsiella pneumoniae]|uniref:hypothetical protein n=1 Tax=Klebsiella pneumoniae TaxID=573 RepID=UPI00388D8534